MRVLFVTSHLPYPPHSGGRLREHELLTRLTPRFDVHVAAVTKTLADDRAALPSIPWETDGLSLFAAEERAASPGVAPQVARHRSAAASTGIRSLLEGGQFDAVHVEGFYLWQHVESVERPPTVLVEQNVEWELFEQRGLRAEMAATCRAELRAWRQADLLGALTDEDAAVMRTQVGRVAQLVPDGADHLDRCRAAEPEPGRLLMVGNFGYGPNVDAALWLAREVLPRIRAAVPQAHLQLVGCSPPPQVRELACAHVEVTGRVPDVRPYLEAAAVVLCPLRFGGGVKVKMLEALSAGKAIVATPIACQGLRAAADAIRVALTAGTFASATAELLVDRALREKREACAREAATRLPCWDDAADALAAAWIQAEQLSLAAA